MPFAANQLKVQDSRFMQQLNPQRNGYSPDKIVQTTRLGIPAGQDAKEVYQFIDLEYI